MYRGKFKGRTVAVKVVEFPSDERKAAAEVAKECQHAMTCRHPAVAACLTTFTVKIRTHAARGAPPRAAIGGRGYELEKLMQQRQAQEAGQQQDPDAAGPSRVAAPAAPEPGHTSSAESAFRAALSEQLQQDISAPLPDSPPPSTGGVAAPQQPGRGRGSRPEDSRPRSCSTSLTGSSRGASSDSVVALLLMEYCSLGNLHSAITSGRFFSDRRSKTPNLVGLV